MLTPSPARNIWGRALSVTSDTTLPQQELCCGQILSDPYNTQIRYEDERQPNTLYAPTIIVYCAVHFGFGVSLVSTSQNTTILVPDSINNHGPPSFICTPTKWTVIALLYISIYAAHTDTARF
ncbi:uncharacterized protein F4822DRAFT_171891 [Hypoxylon trugodes]|uniref:uncharacterized protein n=1 Tax=Hypoxylon trugodes TaxID=326681 RepID=UPI00218EEBE4|nr:uncharacterized protein F4822DRAFT_171891 [Hypoxylon trugodes]KAI1391078.1 hypothetical protein F4822DRAFT_171891 [Hypoxylon trugodes]